MLSRRELATLAGRPNVPSSVAAALNQLALFQRQLADNLQEQQAAQLELEQLTIESDALSRNNDGTLRAFRLQASSQQKVNRLEIRVQGLVRDANDITADMAAFLSTLDVP